ncbi:hypothetical protein CLV58_109108 [Spirosoma oryzae]|uniref:Uncharacterized protein n=1 Tax=Spirosoma oryzae TaxID=1469603 RepID=A0A2T0SY80_9BACT|nr:hypothetical protein [Spirosoma oryzae]PRY38381.1 hypothetical protein CLV58_109108 [Spirosoma oryzae]
MNNRFKVRDWVILVADDDFILKKYYPSYQLKNVYQITELDKDSKWHLAVKGLNSETDLKPSNGYTHFWLESKNFELEDPFQTKVRLTLQQLQENG